MPLRGGLTTAEAKKQLAESGPNVLPQKLPPSDLVIFLSQLKSPLVYVLLLAAGVTAFLRQWPDMAVILVAVGLNTVLGWLQERKASRALYELKQLIHPQAEVVRDGQRVKISAEEVVVGDWVVLASGVKVAADGKIVDHNRLFIDEAILTGESQPVVKNAADTVFMGTVVTAGRGVFEVTKTAAEAEIGQIALSVAEAEKDIPLTRQLRQFSRQILILVLVLTVVVLTVGWLRGRSGWDMAKTAVALAVSAVPEGLLVSLTVVLAIGMQRILKRQGLVRRLSAAETLGGVTTVCVDKTGTLTEGKLQLVEAIGDRAGIATQLLLANDLDDPLTIAAYHWAKSQIRGIAGLERSHLRLDSLPFSARDRFMASLHLWGKFNRILVNGAAEYVLEWSDVSAVEKKRLKAKIDQLAQSGKRLMGLAERQVPTSHKQLSPKDVKDHPLKWVGLIAFADPVRQGVAEALATTQKAGVKVIVITGDYPATASYVLDQLRQPVTADQTLTGEQLDKLTEQDLIRKLVSVMLFARTTPQQKLRIVKALQKRGEVVAMMGDGVNDAPALARANIGIVVGDAADVARETADLVLLDSNFAVVTAAIEEGRGIWDNIRKIILYLLSDAFGEIVAVLGAIIAGLPLPVTAAQILWINLISDGFPNLALTVDPKQEGSMTRPPRPPQEAVVSGWMVKLVALVSIAGGAIAVALFWLTLRLWGDESLSRSVAFASLGSNSLIYVFSLKALFEPVWKLGNLVNNPWLLAAVAGGWGLQLLPFLSPVVGQFMGVVRIPGSLWLVVIASSGVMVVVIEILKLWQIRRQDLGGDKAYIQG